MAAKRGGAAPRANLDEIPDLGSGRARELIALDDGLNALAALDPRKARVIELRFFGGLTVEETAEVLKVSPDTVLRDWRLARAWLLAEMSEGSSQDAQIKIFVRCVPVFVLALRLQVDGARNLTRAGVNTQIAKEIFHA